MTACTPTEPTGKPARPLIVAHRGASAEAPENTLAAVRLGWDQGADAVEFDIHLTRDNRIVVIHDENTKRTTGKDALVRDLTWDQIRILDAGKWKSHDFAGERIPLLEDLLDEIPGEKRAFVEIKTGGEIAGPLAGLLKNHPERGTVALISFDIDVLEEMGRRLPEVPRYWTIAADRDEKGEWAPLPPRIAEQAKSYGFAGVDVQAEGVDAAFMDAARAAKIEVIAWTVDDMAQARRLAGLGVRGIETNMPGKLRETLRGKRN